MSNRIDSFVVVPGATLNTALLSLGFWEGLTAAIVGIGTIALVVYRLRVAHIDLKLSRLDLKLKKAEAAKQGVKI